MALPSGLWRRIGRHGVLWLAVLSLMFGAVVVRAATEQEVKGAFLFNFIKYVKWPESAFTNEAAPFVIGVVGEAAHYQESLPQLVRAEKVRGRSVVIKWLKAGDSPEGCHLVFLPPEENAHAGQWLQAAKGKPILTVGEAENFVAEGGMIRFLVVERKVRFEINVGALEGAGLRSDSRLLALARRKAAS